MSEIISIFTGKEVFNKERTLDDSVNNNGNRITNTIEHILSTPVNHLVSITEEEFELLLRDYLIYNIQKANIGISYEINHGMDYLSKLLSEMMRIKKSSDIELTIANPYYNYWAHKEDYKRAGDACVYNYIFREPSAMMQKQDYISFAINGYVNYFKEAMIAKGIGTILPKIQGLASDKKFFDRSYE